MEHSARRSIISDGKMCLSLNAKEPHPRRYKVAVDAQSYFKPNAADLSHSTGSHGFMRAMLDRQVTATESDATGGSLNAAHSTRMR